MATLQFRVMAVGVLGFLMYKLAVVGVAAVPTQHRELDERNKGMEVRKE